MKIMLLRAAGVLALAIVVSACTTVPSYQPPATQAPDGWDAGAAGAGIWPDPRWWQAFGSDELNALIVEASTNNHDLQAAAIRIDEAAARARIAGAPRWPTLGAGFEPGREQKATSKDLFAGVQASYEIDLFGKYGAAASAARARVEASVYDRQAMALSLEGDVAATFFQILSLRDRQREMAQSIDTAQRMLGILRTRDHAGSASDVELAQQSSIAARQQAALPDLQLAEHQAIAALAVLVGRNPEGFSVTTRSLQQLRVPPVVAGLPSELLLRRPDLRRSEANVRGMHGDWESSHAARFPSIVLTAAGGLASNALGALFNPGSAVASIVGSLTAPILAGGRLSGQEKLDAARYREQVALYDGAVIAAFRDVENALYASTLNQRAIALDREADAQARRALALLDVRYNTGAIDFLAVLDAQRNAVETADALTQAQLARFIAAINLYKALGGGWSDADGRPLQAVAAVAGLQRG
ncbi:efflux transporter outer membrane subunit [Reyranella sp. CPCC 100927]|uniref:efflux transporter outer membrane subunit n=1 Tax=Reyranella sp. CPCC 100927 TaxID=2599616 RepID=UPI0011B40D25|nr:efflux transporter outer membrane subunit [Reyranella sp. CPCC 100927]TWT04999.1 efflux transporter outer membrane subunit [Reyranella sp. CPCC 100927]